MTMGAGAEVRILYVDAGPDRATAVATSLEDERERFSVETATGADEALDALATADVDCVVSEYDIPGTDGVGLLERVREEYPDLPFVLFTGEGSEAIASEAISRGVSEYLRKERVNGDYDVLADRIEAEVTVERPTAPAAETDRMLATLIGNLPGMVYRCRNERGWPMEYVSQGCEALTGYTAEELESGAVQWGEEILHPEDRDEMWTEVQDAVDRGDPFEVTYRIRTGEGDVRWCWERGSGVFEDGDLVALEGFITDITEKRRHEQELERYETIIEAVSDPVYVVDDEGCFAFINDAIEDLAGHAPSDIEGEHVSVLLDEDDVETGERHIRDLIESPERRAAKFEVTVETVDGDAIPCELHIALLPTADGEFRGTAGILRDIEARKEREQRLEEFASVVSHDLRGPLDVILGRATLARETGDVEHVAAIEDAAERMDVLIEDLLTLARQGDTVGAMETTDLEPVVRRAWDSVDAPAATLDSWVTLSLQADPDRLQELLENLLRNAVIHGGDDVTITVGRLDDDRGFFVADDGPGIEADHRDQVFEHGYTSIQDGTGFGLSIVERIARAHGWDVEVCESQAGGARFEVRV